MKDNTHENTTDYKNRMDFLVDMCHELKTPLSVIMGASKLIELDAGSGYPKILKNSDLIEKNCYRLLRLLNNILDMARLDSSHMEFAPVKCNIPELTEQITRSVSPYAEEKGLTLSFKCSDMNIHASADTDLMERILLNLLSNAIKFTPEGGRITVMVNKKNNSVEISVKDTGPGVPKSMKTRIFKRFSRTAPGQGSGIGLALVKSLVELHGGNIRLQSSESKGSTFIVSLPITNSLNNSHNISRSCQVTENVTLELSDVNIKR